MLEDYQFITHSELIERYRKRLARKMIQEKVRIVIQGKTRSFETNFYLEERLWNYKIPDLSIAVGPFESLLEAIVTARADVADLEEMNHLDSEENSFPFSSILKDFQSSTESS